MNFADSEVVASILKKDGYELTDKAKDANLVLLKYLFQYGTKAVTDRQK